MLNCEEKRERVNSLHSTLKLQSVWSEEPFKEMNLFKHLHTAVGMEMVTHKHKEDNSFWLINTWKFYKNSHCTYKRGYCFHLKTPLLILHSKIKNGLTFVNLRGRSKLDSKVLKDPVIRGVKGRL